MSVYSLRRLEAALSIPKREVPGPGILYGYARASTKEQKKSILYQSENLREFYQSSLSRQGYQWGEIFSDFGVSGSSKFHDRKGGMALIQRVSPGDAVVVWQLDRISRNVGDFAERVLKHFKKMGVALFAMDSGAVDLCTPTGTMVAHVRTAMSQFELDLNRERVKTANAHYRSLGLTTSGNTRWGTKNNNGVVVPDRGEIELGEFILSQVENGLGNTAIARLCHDRICPRVPVCQNFANCQFYVGESAVRLRRRNAQRLRDSVAAHKALSAQAAAN